MKNRGRILIIDNDKSIASSLQFYTQDLGYESISINKPRQVISFLKKNPVDLIIMDPDFTSVNSLSFIKKIVSYNKKIKIIIYTTVPKPKVNSELKKVPQIAADIILKPLADIRQLQQAIEEQLP
ncbi:MAG TPA: response regulator [Spirochaetota bacterium]|nr:response regulator [Spirochaetota bacterium]